MNALSWTIYAADVAGTVNAIGFIATISPIPLAVTAFVITDAERSAWDAQARSHRAYPSLYKAPDGPRPALDHPYRKYTKPLFTAAAVSAIIAAIVPSPQTLYAIAASEVGEEVVKSATATKALKALDAWLDAQIARK